MTARSKAADQYDGSRDEEYSCAPVRQFDGGSAIDSSNSSVRLRSLRATGAAPFVGIAMNVGYRQAFEITTEFVRIKF
jgi:hypothetical protein